MKPLISPESQDDEKIAQMYGKRNLGSLKKQASRASEWIFLKIGKWGVEIEHRRLSPEPNICRKAGHR
jgi:hypothetical protein